LVWVAADPGFEYIVALLGGGEDVGFVIARFLEVQVRAEVEDILILVRFPEHESGKDSCAGFEGDAGEAGCGACGDAEEVRELALRRGHIGVHEDADGTALAHGMDEAAREIVFVEDAIAVQTAEVVDELVESAIVESSDDHAHGVAHEGVVEAGELPGAEMAGEHEHAAAKSLGGEIVFEAVGTDAAGSVPGRVMLHLAELDELAGKAAIYPTEDGAALSVRELRKGQGKIALADAPETAHPMEDRPCEKRGQDAGKPARHKIERAHGDDYQPVFERFPHALWQRQV